MKTRKEVYFEPGILAQAKKQAKKEVRNFSNFVEFAVMKYLEKLG